jgi:hypothetical protein
MGREGLFKEEKRRFERFVVHWRSVIIAQGRSHSGSIQNVSEEGIAYIMSAFNQTLKEFAPETIIKLLFSIPTGETLNLSCQIIWTSECNDNSEFCMGMKILEPPVRYIEYVKTLQ